MDKTVMIDWKTVNNILSFEAQYNSKSDVFLMQSKEDRPAVSVDCDGEYWVRVDPETGEILGIEIEDFKRIFLKRHPTLLKQKTTYVRPLADLIQIERCSV